MKDLYISLQSDSLTQEQLKEITFGGVYLKVDGQKLTLDTGSKYEYHNQFVCVNVVDYEGETEIENWRELDFIDVEGAVFVEFEGSEDDEVSVSLLVIGESTRMFDLNLD